MISEYALKARIYPAILSSLPLIVLCNAVFDVQVHDWVQSNDYAALFGKGTLATAVVFGLAQFNRFIATEVFERIISKDETDFPTTRLLLPSCTDISQEMQEAIRTKAQKNLGMELPATVTPAEETKARRQIADVVRRIREKTRGHKLLLQHNIEYGFARNLIGAGPLVLLVSLVNVYLYATGSLPNLPGWGYKASIAYGVVAILLMALSPFITGRYGIRYARVLFQAYLDAK